MEKTISHILQQYFSGEPLTEEDALLFLEWRNASFYNEEVVQLLQDPHFVKTSIQEWERFSISEEATWQQLSRQLFSKSEGAVTPVRSFSWFRKWSWAAVIITVLGAAAYLWTTSKRTDQTHTAAKKPSATDIAPGGDRAVLTLADGSQIMLDSATNGMLAEQGNAQVVKLADGRISYNLKETGQGEVLMNTMRTPRGGQYQLVLPDGSKVWLNAASSITYPAAFTKNMREVSVTGEVYFEVVKNNEKPFVVTTTTEKVTVLGTSFNINAYEEEGPMKVSLTEGAVKVGSSLLHPGEAFINGKIVATDIRQDIAWKNGAFDFRNMELAAVFRQFARWYNVEVRYEGGIPAKKTRGKLGRDLSLSQVLNALKDIGIKTRLEGNTIVVLSN